MADDQEGEEEDLSRTLPRPRKPTGLTPMKAKRGKEPERTPPVHK
jgi:hypothetical protein